MLVTLTILSLYQCANIVAPQGGPKDETPPTIDTANTTPNYQTNYDGSPIVLSFDEWIALKDVVTQVVVSPPLQFPLDVKQKKKSVFVNFNDEEVLKENTTYTINFGEAITDFTEGNVPPDMRYVFSTGDVIDSLKFSARLIDIDTKEPIEGALLMLYVNQSDTVLYKSRPYYFAKTDTSGTATIENIRPDTFKVVALIDGNLNYQLDGETEKLNFLLDPIIVQGDTALGVLEMYLPQQPLIRTSIKNYYGKTTIQFNREPYDLSYNLIGDAPDIVYRVVDGDSLMLWYSDTTRIDWSIVIDTDTADIDTVVIKKDVFAKGKLTSQFDSESKRKQVSFKSDTTLTYKWSRPLVAIDNSKMSLTVEDYLEDLDSTILQDVNVQYQLDRTDPHLLKAVGVDWDVSKKYQWTISGGAVTDLFEVANDSIGKIEIGLIDEKSLGSVKIHFDSLKLDKFYLVELMNRSKVERTAKLSGGKHVVDFKLLPAGNYTIRLIEDDNNNGRWDTGDYDKQTLPERVYIKEMPPLKANWEQEIDFKL